MALVNWRGLAAVSVVATLAACGGGGGDSGGSNGGDPSTPAQNVAPVANAGADQAANAGTTVTLSAAGSSDSDGSIVSYEWTQTLGTQVTLTTDGSNASFVAPTASTEKTYTFQLRVTDDKGAKTTDTIVVTVPAGAPLIEGAFEVDGFTYTPKPVFDAVVTGFGYPAAGAGISDGEASGAHVWYGSDSCVSFRHGGSGVRDMKGGTSTTITSFPHIDVDIATGTESSQMATMRGYSGLLDSVLDPQYVRRDELRTFQWGVRVKADGTVHRDSNGMYEFVMKFEDGSVQRAAWDPTTNAPSTKFMDGDMDLITGEDTYTNLLKGYSTDLPPKGHFCMFREQTSVQLAPRCVEEQVTSFISGTRTLCYSSGMLQGDYTFKSPTGTLLETGKFENNRPAQTWTFYRDDGTLSAQGGFDASTGTLTGEWKYFNTAGQLYQVRNYSGTLTPASNGEFTTVLDGAWADYNPGSSVNSLAEQTGQIVDGERDGVWTTYQRTLDAGTDGKRIWVQEVYDAGTQLNGTSLIKSRRTYHWQSCFGQYMKEAQYNFDGSFASESCSTLVGTSASFTLTPRACPTVSCQ